MELERIGPGERDAGAGVAHRGVDRNGGEQGEQDFFETAEGPRVGVAVKVIDEEALDPELLGQADEVAVQPD